MNNFPFVGRPIFFEVAGSDVRWGSEVRPKSKLRSLLSLVLRSYRYSLLQLLVEEFGSLVFRIAARTRNREDRFRAIVPLCPQRYQEVGQTLLSSNYLHACIQHMTKLQKAHRWMRVEDVQLASEAWSAGFEFAAHNFGSGRLYDMSSISVKQENGWDQLIQQGKEKIERLERTLSRFQEYRDHGAPFPGIAEAFSGQVQLPNDNSNAATQN